MKVAEKILSNKFFWLTLILLIVFILYYRVGNYGFISVWDDNHNVLYNDYIKNFSYEGIKTLMSSRTKIAEPRLTLLTYAVDYKLWGLNSKMYHLENLFLHLINIMLVFFVCLKLIPKLKIAVVTTFLFALHPFRVESVAWVSGRKDLLYTMFFLLTLIVYLKYLKEQKIHWFLLIVFLSYLSYLSKIQAITLPAVLLLFDWFMKRRINVIAIYEKVVLFILMFFQSSFWELLLPFLLIYLFMLKYTLITEWINKRVKTFVKIYTNKESFWYKLVLRLIFSVTTVFYILFMKSLIIETYSNDILSFIVPLLSYGFIIWYTLAEMIERSTNKSKITELFVKHHLWIVSFIGFFFALIFITLYTIPDLSFWDKEFTAQYSFTDQVFMAGFSLISYIFYALFPVKLSSLRPYPDFEKQYLPGSYYFLTGVCILILIAFVIILIKYKSIRKELLFGFLFFLINIFIFLHFIPIQGRVIIAERYTYLSYFGLFFLAGFLIDRLGFFSKSIRNASWGIFLLFSLSFLMLSHYRLPVWKDEMSLLNDQIKKTPDYATVFLNRSNLNINKQNYVDAIEDLNKAILLKPDYYQAFYNRAIAYAAMQLYDKCAENCIAAVQLKPDFAEAHYLLAYSYNKLNNYSSAIAYYSVALNFNPKMHLAYYNRGIARQNIKDYNKALMDFVQALYIKSDFQEAYDAIGVSYFFLGQYEKSLEAYNKALTLNPDNKFTLYNRALLYLKIQQTEKACSDLKKSKQLGNHSATELLEKNCK